MRVGVRFENGRAYLVPWDYNTLGYLPQYWINLASTLPADEYHTTGASGPTGPTGTSGNAGAVGSTGSQGLQGVIGSTGVSGVVGATGVLGASGATGPQGIQGLVGATGIQGIPGVLGLGLVGATGAVGASGATGPAGNTGSAGTSGSVGATGNTGAGGAVGATGVAGPTGVTGVGGAVGATGPSSLTFVKLTADETGKTDANLVNTGLSFAVVSGTYYRFRFDVVYRSTVLTVGLKLGLTIPTATVFSARAIIAGFTTDGAGDGFIGNITSSGDSVISTAVVATNTDYVATIEGIILPSANGTLMVQYAAETTGATVTMRRASAGELITLP